MKARFSFQTQLSKYGATDTNIWPSSPRSEWAGPSKHVIWFIDPKYSR